MEEVVECYRKYQKNSQIAPVYNLWEEIQKAYSGIGLEPGTRTQNGAIEKRIYPVTLNGGRFGLLLHTTFSDKREELRLIKTHPDLRKTGKIGKVKGWFSVKKEVQNAQRNSH